MTTQLLATELANLIQESKRKHNDLRQAAEKSLEELKGIKATSESQAAAELSQRPNFVNPFVIACGTKNVKFTSIAIVCLQRLIVVRALPRSKLSYVLEALREATSAGLDVQLKILQALPSLLQNYATDVQGNLLITALNTCFILQTSKNAIVNNTSAATLQQLVVSVFDKVVAEDRSQVDEPTAGEAPSADGTVKLRIAALDAYRVFNDLCLMTENQRPEYLGFTGLPQTFGLELIESVLTNHAAVFTTHPEQSQVLRARVMPFIISSLKGKPSFAISVRLFRILYTLLRRHLSILPSESGKALDILIHLLDQDTVLWKRALCMEVFRGIFTEHALVRRIFMIYDANKDERDIIKSLAATFVKLSTEKPSAIGLGHQSTIPVSSPYNAGADPLMLDSGGMTGIIGSSVSEGSHTGISMQWSSVRVPYIDQLDKTEPPPIPETYIYSLTLACISSLSEGLAKFILPLTVPGDRGSRKRSGRQDSGRDSPSPAQDENLEGPSIVKSGVERTPSFKKNPVPLNPMALEDHPLFSDIKTCADIIDECWPAILATCSTFLNAALDSEYYHSLVRAFQKFAHVAGLLQLATPRDAFLTTLGKAAVPPNVFTACLNAGSARSATPSTTPDTPSSGLLSNARGLLSRESLVSTSTQSTEKPRQHSVESVALPLNTRNLLCLRALLNLGIALGPTLSDSWKIVLGTLQQADFVLFSTGKTPGRTPTVIKGQDTQAENESNSSVTNFAVEARAVETAAYRLIESTVDFPNPAFNDVVAAICNLLSSDESSSEAAAPKPLLPTSTPSSTGLKPPVKHRRVLSISTTSSTGPNQEDQFALAKLGEIASINIERLLTYPPEESGWTLLISELIRSCNATSLNPSVRTRSSEILVRTILDASKAATGLEDEKRGEVQLRLLSAFRDTLRPLEATDRDASSTVHAADIEIHKTILEGLRTILENCGETLVAGWETGFEIIGSIFIDKKPSPGDKIGGSQQTSILLTRSPKLIRSAFNSLQLICSDFLASLPNSCFLMLVDTLYKFCSQGEDLNIALTTVTFFWALSDFLSSKNTSLDISSSFMQNASVSELSRMASDPNHGASDAALWMLLLLRLTSVTADDRLQLRNTAIQTLLRIFDAYGDKLDAEAWSVCISSVVFQLLSSIEDEVRAAAAEEDADEKKQNDWNDTVVVVLQGISELMSNYLEVLTRHASFDKLWRELLDHFAMLLDFKIMSINAATFRALGLILAQSGDNKNKMFRQTAVDSAWDLWSRDIPTSKEEEAPNTDNQDCLIAYVSAFHHVYRLVQNDLTVKRVTRMLTLLRKSIEQATVGSYSMDVEYTTPLQGNILDAVNLIRTDLPGVPAVLVSQVAEFVTLAFTDEALGRVTEDGTTGLRIGTPKRTFVAMSKASMEILRTLILAHSGDQDIYSSGAFTAGLAALARPIVLKYSFPVETKSVPAWRLATSCALDILDATLGQLFSFHSTPRPVVHAIWQQIVVIADGILQADCNQAPETANTADDQDFDISCFLKLSDLLLPTLGSEVVPEKTRRAYAESLFRTSIVHKPPYTEPIYLLSNPNSGGSGTAAELLSTLNDPRPGRTVAVPPSPRAKMSYVCLDQLFSLVSSLDDQQDQRPRDSTSATTKTLHRTPSITVQPPTPGFPPPTNPEPPQALHTRTARTTSPYLILRAALPLRTYIADRPLQGRAPQPLSHRVELVRVLTRLADLHSDSDAIPDSANVASQSRKHLLRLYPLVISAARVAGSAGDQEILEPLVRILDIVGGEFGS